jgi:hypothetical protein
MVEELVILITAARCEITNFKRAAEKQKKMRAMEIKIRDLSASRELLRKHLKYYQ